MAQFFFFFFKKKKGLTGGGGSGLSSKIYKDLYLWASLIKEIDWVAPLVADAYCAVPHNPIHKSSVDCMYCSRAHVGDRSSPVAAPSLTNPELHSTVIYYKVKYCLLSTVYCLLSTVYCLLEVTTI